MPDNLTWQDGLRAGLVAINPVGAAAGQALYEGGRRVVDWLRGGPRIRAEAMQQRIQPGLTSALARINDRFARNAGISSPGYSGPPSMGSMGSGGSAPISGPSYSVPYYGHPGPVQPGTETQEQGYTPYNPDFAGTGGGEQLPGPTPTGTGTARPRTSNARRVHSSLAISREGMNAMRDSRALEAMRLHDNSNLEQ